MLMMCLPVKHAFWVFLRQLLLYLFRCMLYSRFLTLSFSLCCLCSIYSCLLLISSMLHDLCSRTDHPTLYSFSIFLALVIDVFCLCGQIFSNPAVFLWFSGNLAHVICLPMCKKCRTDFKNFDFKIFGDFLKFQIQRVSGTAWLLIAGSSHYRILTLVYCPVDNMLFKVSPEFCCSVVSSHYCCYGNHADGSKPIKRLFIAVNIVNWWSNVILIVRLQFLRNSVDDDDDDDDDDLDDDAVFRRVNGALVV